MWNLSTQQFQSLYYLLEAQNHTCRSRLECTQIDVFKCRVSDGGMRDKNKSKIFHILLILLARFRRVQCVHVNNLL